MAKRSNKYVAEILSSSKEEDLALDRKITLATEGFTTTKYCKLILRDRNRLSKENALTLSDYVIAMKREINPRLNTIRTAVQFLSELSKCAGIAKKFEYMLSKKDDILLFLDSCRKSENEDPLYKWIGSYNSKRKYFAHFLNGYTIQILVILIKESNYLHRRESLSALWISHN
jgi:hypothetical protein